MPHSPRAGEREQQWGREALPLLEALQRKLVAVEEDLCEAERSNFFFLEEEVSRLSDELKARKKAAVMQSTASDSSSMQARHREEVERLTAEIRLYKAERKTEKNASDAAEKAEENVASSGGVVKRPVAEPVSNSGNHQPSKKGRRRKGRKGGEGQVPVESSASESPQREDQKNLDLDWKKLEKPVEKSGSKHVVDAASEPEKARIGPIITEGTVDGDALEMLQGMEAKIAEMESASLEETATSFFFYEGEMERLREEVATLRTHSGTLQTALDASQSEVETLRASLRQLKKQLEVSGANNTESEQMSLRHEKQVRCMRKEADKEAEKMREATKRLEGEIVELQTMVGDLQCHCDVLKGEKDGFKAMAEAEKERRKAAERRSRETEKKMEMCKIRSIMTEARENVYHEQQENSITAGTRSWKQTPSNKELIMATREASYVMRQGAAPRAGHMCSVDNNGARVSPR